MPPIISFNGVSYKLTGLYYRPTTWGHGSPCSLHRAIYEDAHGPIPDGYEVHHIDFDSLNNRLDNLTIMEKSEHRRIHALRKIADGTLKPPSALAKTKAAEWHASTEGLAWHSMHAKNSWATREPVACTCVECSATFWSFFPNRAKYCDDNCKARHRRKLHPTENAEIAKRHRLKAKAQHPDGV